MVLLPAVEENTVGTPKARDCIDRYLESLQAAGRSEHTVRARRCTLLGLWAFAKSDNLRHVCCAIPPYLSAQFDRLDHNSVSVYWRQLHHWCGWCVNRGYLKNNDNPFESLARPLMHLKVVRPLTDPQLHQLFQAADTWDRAILIVLLSTGMRVGELVSLRWPDVDSDTLRVYGKGGKERLVALGVAGSRVLSNLPRNGHSIFPFKVSSIENRLQRLSQRSGVHVHAHLLRHTSADRLRQSGVNIEDISILLGHSSTTITMCYLGREPERALEEQRLHNPADALLAEDGRVVPFQRR